MTVMRRGAQRAMLALLALAIAFGAGASGSPAPGGMHISGELGWCEDC